MGEHAPVVVLVEPSEPGNIGTAARAMRNFGFEELLLVDPPHLDPEGEAYGFAGRAREDVLPNATTVSLESVVESYYTIGFTSTPNEDPSNHTRYPYVTPSTLAEELLSLEADTALVFGRERTGLVNDELELLDRICTIPASTSYPALNLGQAVTLTLYELRELTEEASQLAERPLQRAEEEHIEHLYNHVEEYLEAINHPREKRDKANRLFRRIIGRAHPTEREIATLTGLIRRGAEYASPPGEDGEESD